MMPRQSCRWLSFVAAFACAHADPGTRYRAAVVEIGGTVWNPNDQAAAWTNQMAQVARIEHFSSKAAKQGVDIIAFPEIYIPGINFEYLFKPGEDWEEFYAETLPQPSSENICIDDKNPKTIAEAVACVAKKHGILIVTGIGDSGPCPTHKNPFSNKSYPCHQGIARYNSLAAFGRDGNLLAKYRKPHLANHRINAETEDWAENDKVEPVTFMSHFGVRFGMFICNDANFGGPIRGIKEQGVRDIVYPTHWINVGIAAMAVSFQDAFSRAHGMNFIASNSDQMGLMSSGSGIWPANISRPFVQRISRDMKPPEDEQIANPPIETTDGWMGVLDLESPTVAKASLAEVEYPKDARLLTEEGTVQTVIANLTAGTPTHVSASVPGSQCEFDVDVIKGSGLYGFLAVRGIHDFGWYTAKCVMHPCPDNMDKTACESMLTSCGRMQMQPDDPCYTRVFRHTQAWTLSGPTLGKVKIHINAPGTNTYFPAVMCSDYLVPSRSMYKDVEVGEMERELHVDSGACDLGATYSMEGRAQSENERAITIPPYVPVPVFVPPGKMSGPGGSQAKSVQDVNKGEQSSEPRVIYF